MSVGAECLTSSMAARQRGFTAELPGMVKENLEINVRNDVLTILGRSRKRKRSLAQRALRGGSDELSGFWRTRHVVGYPACLDGFIMYLGVATIAAAGLRGVQRAIGVIYRPDTERMSHYFHARLPDQFDVMLHYDRTRAVEPLETSPRWTHGEVPETWPTAL